MFSIHNLSKAHGARILFKEASLQFQTGRRYGIVGANGSGKSTLLRMVSGDEVQSDGTVSVPKRARIGILRQDQFKYEHERIVDTVLMGLPELWEAMVEKEKILANAEHHFDADRYGELEDIVMRYDGYTIESKAGEILEGLNIPTAVHGEPMSMLSGGFKLRVLLAQTLVSDPDILLLDEPTNHLDILSIRWLEKFLLDFRGCLLVVSHDRRFLDRVCTDILDVDYELLTHYPGNYSFFEEAKKEHRDRKEREIEKRQQMIADKKAFIERFKAKATKARQAQSRVKQVERIEIETLPPSSRQYPNFRFPAQRPSGKDVVKVKKISKAYGDKVVLNDVSLTVRRGDRVAIIGPNGIGKSTLLKIMMDRLHADAGEIEWGYETHPGYFSQDHKEMESDAQESILNWLWRACPERNEGFVRAKLAMVLFGRDDVDKRVGALSGGEVARLVFSQIGIQEPNVLVLDEPTNHLDIEGIEALAKGLLTYEGTLLLVSHDRWFIERLANRVIEIRPDGIEDFQGTFAEYIAKCGDDHLDDYSVASPSDTLAKPKEKKAKNQVKESAETSAKTSTGKKKKKNKKKAATSDAGVEAKKKGDASTSSTSDGPSPKAGKGRKRKRKRK